MQNHINRFQLLIIMRIHSISAKNYRPFKTLEETVLGQLATIVGKNDAGKSSILRAIELFLDKKPELVTDHFHDSATPEENLIIEASFDSLPEKIRIEEDVETTLRDELLVDKNENLRIRKVFSREGKIAQIIIVTNNIQDPYFAELAKLKEAELNKRCKEKGIEATKSGRGITNKEKRKALRDAAIALGATLGNFELELSAKDDLWKTIESLLPSFNLFESEHKIDPADVSFQKEFRPIVDDAANHPDVAKSKAEFEGTIEKALQKEVEQICIKLRKYTDAVDCLTAKAVFAWEKAVTLQLLGKDHYGVDKPLERRGTGIRRLLMVAFFEHIVEKKESDKHKLIYGIEEPENGLHPGLQRELVSSFRKLVDQGCQVIITTHSPVFAGASPIEDLVLITRENAVAKSCQSPILDLEKVAKELGVEPSDQIIGYKACVFVEGPDDILFWTTVASKLKTKGLISSDFAGKRIGLILVGGDNVKFWINMGTMKKLSQKFAVVKDSDKKKADDVIGGTLLNYKAKCEADGGIFIVSMKREIENYLHPHAIESSGRELKTYDDFSDMKVLFGDNVIKVIAEMTSEEILEKDKYYEGTTEHHELKEIIEKLLAMA